MTRRNVHWYGGKGGWSAMLPLSIRYISKRAKPAGMTRQIDAHEVNAGRPRFPRNKKVNKNPATNPPMCAI